MDVFTSLDSLERVLTRLVMTEDASLEQVYVAYCPTVMYAAQVGMQPGSGQTAASCPRDAGHFRPSATAEGMLLMHV